MNDFSCMWGFFEQTEQNENQLIDTENRLVVPEGEEAWGKGKAYGDRR